MTATNVERFRHRPYDPLVSIVMATYNYGHFLPYTLRSIADQTYANFELVLVDDGSTDDTERVVAKFVDSFPLVYVRLEHNGGLAAALNLGLLKSKGDFIARHDSDDYMYDIRLLKQVEFLLENVDVDLVGTGVDTFQSSFGIYRAPASHSEIVNAFVVSNPFYHPTIMFRRRLLDAGIYNYDETLPTDEDYELWSRLLPHCRSANMQMSLIKYRIHSTNNGRHPARKTIKRDSIRRFLEAYDLTYAAALADSLSEFQCSGYVSFDAYSSLREYAVISEQRNLPRLGWIHDPLVQARSYREFSKVLLY
jgi:glycosyltransferase involved in cell wall biosynthesis